MDTDTMLQPIHVADDQVEAWKDVVKANTAALKEIRLDLNDCNNVDKVRAIMAKVEKAIEDLSVESQKIPPWVKAAPPADVYDPYRLYGTVAYGQYPVDDPLHLHNPVPRPPSEPPSTPSEPVEPPLGGGWGWLPGYGWVWFPVRDHPTPSEPTKGGKR